MTTDVSPPRLVVEIYSHGLRCHSFHEDTRRVLIDFARTMAEYGPKPIGRGQSETAILRVFASYTRKRDEFFFHRNQLLDLKDHLQRHGLNEYRVRYVETPLYDPLPAEFTWNSVKEPREPQVAIRDFLLKPTPPIKVVTLQPGGGKTLATLFTLRDLKQRVVMIMSPRYMEQWTKVMMENLKFKKGDLIIVQGGAALRKLMGWALQDEADFNPQVILISLPTYRDYLSGYLEQSPLEEPWPIKPWDFFKVMGAGVRVVDECHEEIHLLFKLDTTTHVPKSIALSGTLEADSQFTNQIYRIMYPGDCWAPVPAIHKYIDLYSVAYTVVENDQLKYKNFMGQYSHSEYEKSIMRHRKLWKAYINMILDLVEFQFVRTRLEGQKALIFCGMKEMCTAVMEAAKLRWPELKIFRKVAGDPESVLVDGDLIVTTKNSCGTGKDIHGLTIGFSSVALSAKQANKQMVGRLRPLDNLWPGVHPKFFFLHNGQNPKHALYVRERKEKLTSDVRSISSMPSTFRLSMH